MKAEIPVGRVDRNCIYTVTGLANALGIKDRNLRERLYDLGIPPVFKGHRGAFVSGEVFHDVVTRMQRALIAEREARQE